MATFHVAVEERREVEPVIALVITIYSIIKAPAVLKGRAWLLFNLPAIVGYGTGLSLALQRKQASQADTIRLAVEQTTQQHRSSPIAPDPEQVWNRLPRGIASMRRLHVYSRYLTLLLGGAGKPTAPSSTERQACHSLLLARVFLHNIPYG